MSNQITTASFLQRNRPLLIIFVNGKTSLPNFLVGELLRKSCTIWSTRANHDFTYTRQRPSLSAFVLENGVVFHTYSAYSRGVDALWSMYQWLARAPNGRNKGGGDLCGVAMTSMPRHLRTPTRAATEDEVTLFPS